MAFPPSYPGQMRPQPALVIQQRRYSDATRKRRKHRAKVSGTGLWAIPLFIARAWSHCISDMAMHVVQAMCCIWSLLHLVVQAYICVGSTSPPRERVKYCPTGMTTCPAGYTVYENGTTGRGVCCNGCITRGKNRSVLRSFLLVINMLFGSPLSPLVPPPLPYYDLAGAGRKWKTRIQCH